MKNIDKDIESAASKMVKGKKSSKKSRLLSLQTPSEPSLAIAVAQAKTIESAVMLLLAIVIITV